MASEPSTKLVRTVGAPAYIPEGTIAELFLTAVDAHQKPDALKYKRAGAWHSLSHRRIYEDVKRVALGLEALGIESEDRVAILSENRPEWLICDFACVMAKAISVPLYAVLPAEQIRYMLVDSEAKAIFVSSEEQLAKVRELRIDVSTLAHVVVFDEALGGEPDVISLQELMARGDTRLSDHDDGDYRARALATDPHQILTILYTSGTTGEPKGVMLTHNNLVSNVRSSLQVLEVVPEDVSLSVLPLSHIFERMAGHYVMFSAGVTICYAESFAAVGQNFLEVRPTVMTMVPRGYEKIFARVEQVAREGGAAKQRLLHWAVDVARRHLDRKLAGERPGAWLGLQYRLADRLVFTKLRRFTGGRIRYFVSGGAPLNPDLARFFVSAGLPILEGYGLTETSPVVSFNRRDSIKPGTVGQPIPGVEVGIAEDGEILTRGPHVMKGYYKKPEATAEAIDPDGWFHTGDVGELDRDGCLSITDRKKDLIVTAGGKNIAPQPIENRVSGSPYVSQVVMIGDRRRFPILVVVPEFDALASWAQKEGLSFQGPEDLVADRKVVEFMEREILESLADLSRHERPKKLALLANELSLDNGEITPTLKVKRRVVEERYKDIIDALYSET